MSTITLTHAIHRDAKSFWQIFFDPAFNDALFRRELGFPRFEVTSVQETPAGLVRVVEAQPKVSLPAPVAKALGASFGYRETGTFERDANTYRWSWRTSAMTERLHFDGVLRTAPAGEGACERIVTLTLRAEVFGLGGLIEAAAEKAMREAWDKSAAFTNNYKG